MKNKAFGLFMGIGLLFASCGGPGEMHTAQVENLELIADFPLYEGANTATGEWHVSIDDLTGIQGLDAKSIKSVRVKSALVKLFHEEDEGLLEEITLQITASAASMKKVAFMNPVPELGSEFDLQIADNQKGLAELFKQDKVVFVADVNIREDYDDDLRLLLTLELEVEFKKP
jgi:hypothetical protein